MRRHFLVWTIVVTLFVASGAPYLGYMLLRNKLLAHCSFIHPDDSVHMGYFGLMGRLPNMLSLGIWLANPRGTVYMPPGVYPQDTPFSLKSNLSLIGSGKGDTLTGCVTTIT